MFVWLQVIFFIITNAPALIKAIRDIRDAFGRDKTVAKSVLNDLKEAKRKNPKAEGQDFTDIAKEVLRKYQIKK